MANGHGKRSLPLHIARDPAGYAWMGVLHTNGLQDEDLALRTWRGIQKLDQRAHLNRNLRFHCVRKLSVGP
jgi:hypothetical protein